MLHAICSVELTEVDSMPALEVDQSGEVGHAHHPTRQTLLDFWASKGKSPIHDDFTLL